MRHKTIGARPSSPKPLPTRKGSPSAPGAGRPSGLHIDIGGVTLEGYGPGDRAIFHRSLEAGLAELAQSHKGHAWSSADGSQINRLDIGRLPQGASAGDAGLFVARQIFAKLTRQVGGKHNA